MFEKYLEENPYTFTLAKRLSNRTEQLSKLHLIQHSVLELTETFIEYNNYIVSLETANNRHDLERDNDLLLLPQLQEVFVSLNKYVQFMDVYKRTSVFELKDYLSLSSKLSELEPGVLSILQREQIKRNKEYFLGQNYNEIYQDRLSIQLFLIYIRTDLKPKINYKSSFFQVIRRLLLKPFSFWEDKSWRLLFQRDRVKKNINEMFQKIESLCSDALISNARQFQYRAQTIRTSDDYSVREKYSLEKLLKDSSIQKHLRSIGIISMNDSHKISGSWFSIFKKINLLSDQEVQLVPVNKPIEISKLNEFKDVMEKISSVIDPRLSKKHFGMKFSLIEGYLHYSKKSSFKSELSKVHLYRKLIMTLYSDFNAFLLFQADVKINLTEKKTVFLTVNRLVNAIHQNERALLLSNEGKDFLDIIKYFKKSLSNFKWEGKAPSSSEQLCVI